MNHVATGPAATAAEPPDVYSVRDYGAQADGKTDDTAAFQKALDAAAAKGGGVVYPPRGNYFFAGHLNIPAAVTLKGVWESVPAHNGIRDRGLPKPTDDGTTFLVTESRGKEDGPPFITLNHNSTLKGVVMYYPEQDPAVEPVPYPYAIAMRGKNLFLHASYGKHLSSQRDLTCHVSRTVSDLLPELMDHPATSRSP